MTGWIPGGAIKIDNCRRSAASAISGVDNPAKFLARARFSIS